MSDTGSSRHRPPRPPQRRPPPLLVIAASGLAVVLGLGVMLVLRRGPSDGEKNEAASAHLPAESEAAHAPPPAPSPNPAATRTEAPARAVAPTPAAIPPAEEVPEWERKPLRTAQPFPEEARIDPPAPPMKVPPEMLVPLAAPDAAGAR